jgi:GNAT superfamily N-acetyltransferase
MHVYVASHGGRPAGCMTSADVGTNTEIQMVAVVPEARGGGISGKLLRHALADAAERGMETSTLVATKLGLPNYERAGYRPLGRMSMWELAPGTAAGSS